MSAPSHTPATLTEDASHGNHAGDHHVLSPMVYFGVYVALLVLTAVTVAVSVIGLGVLSIPAALTIAVIKAAFVVGYFMHLKYDVRFNSLVFFSALLFLAIFFSFTFFDLGARGQVLNEIDTFTLREYEHNRHLEQSNGTPGAETPGAETPSEQPSEPSAPAEDPGH